MHESKNEDRVKTIEWSAKVCFSHEEFDKASEFGLPTGEKIKGFFFLCFSIY